VFRIQLRDTGARWTFRVPRSTLEELGTAGTNSPQALFDLYRHHIYEAATKMIATGGPLRQQTITKLEVTRRPAP
jgi:hypothetical protein